MITFRVGQTISNRELYEEFKCGVSGGMRKSNTKNALVVVADHTKALYDDKWLGDTLHYTGMGKSEDQSLDYRYNKTLAESNQNGVEIHLFEVLVPREYIYQGLAYLAGEPYQEIQKGEDGIDRLVWMFPLRLVNRPLPIPEGTLAHYMGQKAKEARRMEMDKLRERAEQTGSVTVSSRRVESNVFVRDAFVAEYAKRRANGRCELCEESAPFHNKDGEPYLESHHIEWIAKGGSDTIDNTVALCPNCHRKMHVLDLPEDRRKLVIRARK